MPAIVVVPQSPRGQLWHPLFVDAVMTDAAARYRFVGVGLVQFSGEGPHMQTLMLVGSRELRYQGPEEQDGKR